MDQQKLVGFLGFWVVSVVVLLILDAILGVKVHLGNAVLTTPLAAVLSGLILTVAAFLVPSAVDKLGYKQKNENIWAAIFLGVNIVLIWIVKTLADFTGLGVASIFYVILMAIVLTIAQLGVVKVTGAMKSKK